MLYIVRADVVNCILDPVPAHGRAGFLLGGRLKQGFQSIDGNQPSAAYLDAGELAAIIHL